jgi:hypothetical protein
MNTGDRVVLSLLATLSLSVHASTEVTDRNEIVTGEIPRPAHIWVYDFSATASDVPAESALSGQIAEPAQPQTADQIAAGRQLGAAIASDLVQDINAMGMTAQRPMENTQPALNDLVIRGHLVSEAKGDEKKRVLVGFGAGESELKVAVEGFQVTANGLRRLGSGDTDSKGGRSPGVGVGLLSDVVTHNPLGLIVSSGMKVHEERSGSGKLAGRAKDTAKKIADVLEERFKEQGWIDGK